jgi:threonine dehydrogenase-like Zn-dependent dehydrogenase
VISSPTRRKSAKDSRESKQQNLQILASGKVKVDGIVNKVYKIEQWEECLEAMRNKTAIK